MRRKGEPPGGHYYRSDRFFMANGAWYFSTREQIDVGPFQTRIDAVEAAEKLIAILRGEPDSESARKAIHDFIAFHVRK
jgi:uncharacterized protein DUF6316